MGIKKLPEIRTNLSRAERWVHGAGLFLSEVSLTGPLDIENAKRWAQQAKKLIDEAIADLDGLIQDRVLLLKNGSFIGPTALRYESALCHECGEPDCCVDTEYEAAVADLRPLFGVPQDGPGWGEEPWWM